MGMSILQSADSGLSFRNSGSSFDLVLPTKGFTSVTRGGSLLLCIVHATNFGGFNTRNTTPTTSGVTWLVPIQPTNTTMFYAINAPSIPTSATTSVTIVSSDNTSEMWGAFSIYEIGQFGLGALDRGAPTTPPNQPWGWGAGVLSAPPQNSQVLLLPLQSGELIVVGYNSRLSGVTTPVDQTAGAGFTLGEHHTVSNFDGNGNGASWADQFNFNGSAGTQVDAFGTSISYDIQLSSWAFRPGSVDNQAIQFAGFIL